MSERGQAIAFQERGREGGRNVESQEDLAYSLNAPRGGGRRQEMTVAFAQNQCGDVTASEVFNALSTNSNATGRATAKVAVANMQGGKGMAGFDEDRSPTLGADTQAHAVATPYAVRRLTPEECEALQGFPRGWTRIPWRNRPAEQCPDGPRYRAIGNSMAMPVMRWIGERIALFEEVVA